MSARGTVFITSTNDDAILATPYVQKHLHECAESGEVLLGEINAFDADRLSREAPGITWVAYADPDTETPGMAFVHLPGKGIYTGAHVDNEAVVPLDQVVAVGWDALLAASPDTVAMIEALAAVAGTSKNR